MNLNNIFVIPTNVLETSSGNSTLSQRGSNIMNNEKISGIYKWVNRIDKKYYVGSSGDILGHKTNGRKYQHHHALINNKHYNNHLQSAWNKYGSENFEFVIVESNIPEDKLLIIEQKYLDIAKIERDKCYNQTFIAGRVEMTNEIREKISQTKSNPEFSKKFASQMMGKDNPNYQNGDKIRGIKNPFYGKKHSDESKRKMSEKRTGKNNYGYDFSIYTFHNLVTKENFTGTRHDFYTKFNLNKGSVCNVICKRYRSIKNWIMVEN